MYAVTRRYGRLRTGCESAVRLDTLRIIPFLVGRESWFENFVCRPIWIHNGLKWLRVVRDPNQSEELSAISLFLANERCRLRTMKLRPCDVNAAYALHLLIWGGHTRD